jgi:hypothetical protein
MFCAPEHFFVGTEGIVSCIHVFHSRTHFQRYRGPRVPLSCFALPDSFSAEEGTSDPVFMFYAPGHVFVGNEGLESRIHVFRSQTRFPRYRGRRVSFSCFALLDSFSAVPRASVPNFMFGALEYNFGGTVGVGFLFHVLRCRTSFRRYRGRWVLLSYFALADSFSAVPRASGAVFMFYAPKLFFGGTVGVESLFHVLRSRNRFRWYRRRLVPFSCFPLPASFSTVPGASRPVFMFCAPELVFGRTMGVASRFHVWRSRTRFRRYLGRRV